MTKNHFVNLATFNLWANKKICDFISANLSAENTEREIVSSFPSVKKTLYHIWDAEHIWLERLHGILKSEFPSKLFIGTFEVGAMQFLKNSTTLVEFVSGCDEKFFSGEIFFIHSSGDKLTQKVDDVLTHVVNHSTFHRGQLITMFRQLGLSEGMPRTDFIAYRRERL